MVNGLKYLLAATAGVAGAMLYFGGLWLTVQQLADSGRPYLLLVASFFVRAALLMLLFFAVGGIGLPALVLAVVVFILTRLLLTRYWGISTNAQGSDHGSHADAR